MYWITTIYVYSNGGQTACIQCAVGTYKTASGTGSCLTCPAGSECPTVTAGM